MPARGLVWSRMHPRMQREGPAGATATVGGSEAEGRERKTSPAGRPDGTAESGRPAPLDAPMAQPRAEESGTEVAGTLPAQGYSVYLFIRRMMRLLSSST